uniref:Uncharacterized protein n=1 Tax=Cucumis melo TaxID=3656 RepID=A0A9I9E766_CUCME
MAEHDDTHMSAQQKQNQIKKKKKIVNGSSDLKIQEFLCFLYSVSPDRLCCVSPSPLNPPISPPCRRYYCPYYHNYYYFWYPQKKMIY